DQLRFGVNRQAEGHYQPAEASPSTGSLSPWIIQQGTRTEERRRILVAANTLREEAAEYDRCNFSDGSVSQLLCSERQLSIHFVPSWAPLAPNSSGFVAS